MGEVWLADQLTPVERRVALKLIKLGMESRQVVARFEAERQALALMDHPAIAKVLDAGTTAEGRAYFVMEYVPGVPITSYCNAHQLTIEQRLQLFIEICGGVQHAHQKAIIHRDLKPSNILVMEVDGRPQPKIIDFGVAKAIAHRLTEKTLCTEAGSLIGTPEYMSPEQADVGGQDVDTRTDVYALGVVLYELLTGVLPFASAELRSLSYEQLRRKLQEVDPPRPSTRVTQPESADSPAKRQIPAADSLSRRLRGDLDAITMKAMEKDRARRYGAASDLAADLERYLRHEPVVARRPSRIYKLRKYARRHAVLLLALSGVILSVVAGGVVATIALVQARRARAEEARQRGLAERRLEAAEAYAEDLFSQVAPAMSSLPGSTELRGRFISRSSDFLTRLGVGLQDDPRIRWLTARVELSLGELEGGHFHSIGSSLTEYPKAINHGEHVLSVLGSLPVDFPSALDRTRVEIQAEDLIAFSLCHSGEVKRGLEHIDRMRKLAESFGSEGDRIWWTTTASTGQTGLLLEMGRYEEAIPLIRGMLAHFDADYEKRFGAEETLSGRYLAHLQLAWSLPEVGDLSGGLEHAETSAKLARELLQLKPNDPRYVLGFGQSSIVLGSLYLLAHRLPQGLKLIDTGMEQFAALIRQDPNDEYARLSYANKLSYFGHRVFSTAQSMDLSAHQQTALVSRAMSWWSDCRQLLVERPRADSTARRAAPVPDCGGSDAEAASRMLQRTALRR
jgi:tetratricopeptide (TPR) repeat protein